MLHKRRPPQHSLNMAKTQAIRIVKVYRDRRRGFRYVQAGNCSSWVDPQFGEQIRIEAEVRPSVVTLKPAIRGHFKTGHRDWPET